VAEHIHEMEEELVSLRIENKALRDEADEANATAVDFSRQANELHQRLEKVSREHKEMLALLRKTEQTMLQLQASGGPAWDSFSRWEQRRLAWTRGPSGLWETFRSLDAMLADESIELVVVNTPSVTHFDYARQALEAGKHIIVEKPFTATVAEAEELIALAAKKKLKERGEWPNE
jgi:homoserine dehydrogenase